MNDDVRSRAGSAHGIGASLPRKEDDRFLRGRGQYVGNIQMVGMRDVAFVPAARSPMAASAAIQKPAGAEDTVFTLADLDGVQPIVADSGLKGFKFVEQPVLAGGKVRQVGELVAMCVARQPRAGRGPGRAGDVDYDELPAVVDMLAARGPASALVHEHWGDNVFLTTEVGTGPGSDFDSVCGARRSRCGAAFAPRARAWRRWKGAA
jgi:carbon-monoxide dehydrogenase large subunit